MGRRHRSARSVSTRRRLAGVIAILTMSLGLMGPVAADAAPARSSVPPKVTTLPWAVPGYAGGEFTAVSCWAASECVAVGSVASQQAAPLAMTLSGTTWSSTEPPPPFDGPAQLIAVSCADASYCIALGEPVSSTGDTFAEVLKNGAWSAVTLPSVSGAGTLYLNGIDCAADRTCRAVGSQGSKLIVDTETGGTWTTTEPSAPPGVGADLTAIDCATPTSCLAVGTLSTGDGLVETLDSGSWTESSIPAPGGGTTTLHPTSVSCPAAGQCVAVGIDQANQTYTPTAFEQDGADWAQTTIPQPMKQFDASVPLTVACASAGACTAVGSTGFGAFAATLDAGKWTAANLSGPDGADGSYLSDIDCVSVAGCIAVGEAQAGRYGDPVEDTLSSSGWTASVVSVPGPPDVTMTGVSCAAPTQCVGVGDFIDDQDRGQAMAEVRDGSSWTGSAIPPKNQYPEFRGVSCPSSTWCLAIFTVDGSVFSDTWNRRTWTVAVVPLADTANGSLAGVSSPSCPAIGFCRVAIDQNAETGSVGFAVETLSKGSWTSAALGKPAGSWDQVFQLSISCPTVSWCAAIGVFNASGGGGELAETLSGGRWKLATIPPAADAVDTDLRGLSCASPEHCTAVGQDADDVSDYWNPLVETMSDGVWTGAVLPLPDDAYNSSLSSVSCVGPASCVSVGYFTDEARDQQKPLIEVLTPNGASPTEMNNAVRTSGGTLRAVSCVIGASCTAVGDAVGDDAGRHPIEVQVAAPTYDDVSLAVPAARTVRYRSTTTLTATMRDVRTHRVLADEPLTLWRRQSPSGRWTKIATAPTSSRGVADVSLKPTRNARYQWRSAASATHAAATSSVQTVRVAPAVAIHVAHAHVRHGSTITIYGTVSPARSGQPVDLQQRIKGSWKTVSVGRQLKRRLPNGRNAVAFEFARRDSARTVTVFRVESPTSTEFARSASASVRVSTV